jgi:hypothetical protein
MNTPARKPGRPSRLVTLGLVGPTTVPIKAPLRTVIARLRMDANHDERRAKEYTERAAMNRDLADLLESALDAPPPPPSAAFVSAPEAAKRLRMELKQLHRWIEQGQLPVLRDPDTGQPRKPYRLRLADIEALFRGAP